MDPVEKMAARLLRRHNIVPPYDLEELANKYGNVEHRLLPISADGVTVGIGRDEKPTIIINSSPPETRKKFTLAHELGHIIIPWHTGTIVSHIDQIDADLEYREMESEANKFAAEILMPEKWLLEKEKSLSSFENYIKDVLHESGASRDAAFIKIFKTIETPIICAEVDEEGRIERGFRTRSAPSSGRLRDRDIFQEEIFHTNKSEESFRLKGLRHKCWFFANTNIRETDPRPWREVLSEILADTGKSNLLQSVNAVLASQHNRNKEKTEEELCRIVLQAYDGRLKFTQIVSHPLFNEYVIKRIRELSDKAKRR